MFSAHTCEVKVGSTLHLQRLNTELIPHYTALNSKSIPFLPIKGGSTCKRRKPVRNSTIRYEFLGRICPHLSGPSGRNHKSLAIGNHNFEVASFSRRDRNQIAVSRSPKSALGQKIAAIRNHSLVVPTYSRGLQTYVALLRHCQNQTKLVVADPKSKELASEGVGSWNWTQTFFSQTFRASAGYPGKIPGYPAKKVWFSLVSRDIPNFLAPTPSQFGSLRLWQLSHQIRQRKEAHKHNFLLWLGSGWPQDKRPVFSGRKNYVFSSKPKKINIFFWLTGWLWRKLICSPPNPGT